MQNLLPKPSQSGHIYNEGIFRKQGNYMKRMNKVRMKGGMQNIGKSHRVVFGT